MSFLNTFTSPRVKTNLKLVNTNIGAITPAAFASNRVLNVIDPGADDDFLFKNATQTISNKTLGNALAFGGFKGTGAADPTAAQDVATKAYVDSVASGLDVKPAVIVATTAALPANTYSAGVLTATANGALTVDGVAVTVGQRVLVKNEVTAANNGVYTLTAPIGDASHPYILTRATDANANGQFANALFYFVEQGTANNSTGWVSAANGSFTLGTTALTYTQFSGVGSYTNGNGLSLSGGVFTVVGTANRISVSGSGVDIASTYVGQNSITTLGTISSGTWNGTAVGVLYGGTGSSTASGARSNLAAAPNAAGYYLTGSNGELGSGVVLAQGSGITLSAGTIAIDSTVATLTGAQTLTNKTLTTPVVNQAQIFANVVTKSANFTASVSEDDYMITTGSSAVVVTVPQAVAGNKGKRWTFTKVDNGSGTFALTPTTSTINGAASATIDLQYDSFEIVSDGTNYAIV